MDFFGLFKRDNGNVEENTSGETIEKITSGMEEDGGQEVTKEISTTDNTLAMVGGDSALHRYLVAPVSTNKQQRLNEYRSMSNHVEVNDAIDEISDSIYNLDEGGQFSTLVIRGNETKYTDKKKEVLNAEFAHFISLFNFEDQAFDYARRFVIEGELVFENIIDPKNPTKGILSVKILDNDNFEYLKELSTSKNIGILFRVPKKSISQILSPDFMGGLPYFREIDVSSGASSYSQQWLDGDTIPLLWSQITYIHSSIYDKNRTFVYPPLDKARQAYRQLTLIEDGVIIYRVARSPERLVFNIASGNASGQKAQQTLLQMMKRFNMRKATKQNADGTTRGINNFYDAHQPVESYWFLKPSEDEGSSVESIGGQSNFGELEDLKFFTRKLYRSMKVPFNRFEQPENTISQGEDITYEEYRFAKFIVRLQNTMASGLYEGFKTHLKLKGLWKQYDIKTQDLRIKIAPPALYDLYQTAKLNSMRMEAYAEVADNENFSWTMAQKTILNKSDEDITENIEALKKEAMITAEIEFWSEKVAEYGSVKVAEKVVQAEWKELDPEEEAEQDDAADEDSKE